MNASLLPPRAGRSAGFTLMEILLVLLILGILVSALAFTGMGLFRSSAEKRSRIRLVQLDNLIEQYRSIEGQFPDDRLPAEAGGLPPNAHAEALFLAFYHPEYGGERPDPAWLVNSDGDESRKPLSSLPDRQLFELGDEWGNPIVYFDSLHYDAAVAAVLAGPEGELVEQEVRPRKNPRSGAWEAPGRFQILSAGADGLFGTGDDLGNFEIDD